jgi:predicted transcriptional regulator
MPRKKRSSTPTRKPRQARGSRGVAHDAELAEVSEVLRRAEGLYPKLRQRRDALAAELARIDAALSQLRSVVDGGGAVARPAARPALPSAAPAPAVGRPRGGAPSVATVIMGALSKATEPQTAGDLAEALRRAGRAVGSQSIQMALKGLREKGLVRATGKAKRFKYEAAPGARGVVLAPKRRGRPPKNVATATAKRTAGPIRKSNGRVTMRELIVNALKQKSGLNMSQLADAIAAVQPGVNKANLPKLLRRLRDGKVITADGSPRSFRYSLAK